MRPIACHGEGFDRDNALSDELAKAFLTCVSERWHGGLACISTAASLQELIVCSDVNGRKRYQVAIALQY